MKMKTNIDLKCEYRGLLRKLSTIIKCLANQPYASFALIDRLETDFTFDSHEYCKEERELITSLRLLSEMHIPDTKESKEKAVYIMELSNGEVKVGVSNNIKKRIENLENVNRCQISRCKHTPLLPELIALRIEKIAKDFFDEDKSYGEYFKMQFEDMASYVSYQLKLQLNNNDAKLINYTIQTINHSKVFKKKNESRCE